MEREKAWETSWTRRLMIAVLTYLTASLFLWTVGNLTPLLQSLVPTGGYLLSTLSIPWVKKYWMEHAVKQ